VDDLPETMRAVQIRHVGSNGGPEALEMTELPVPIPGPLEIVIKVAAAGVNRPDILQRQGLYPPPPGHSPIPGLEVSGTIAVIGSEVPMQIPSRPVVLGDRVCALTNGGGYAEYCAVPYTQFLPVPACFPNDDEACPDAMLAAACIPETYFTVWHNLFQQRNIFGERTFEGIPKSSKTFALRADEGDGAPQKSFLVHGGSSGIGTTAIQLARAFGATTYATAGSAMKCEVIEALGGVAINYQECDFTEQIQELTGGDGVDIILDMVGGNGYMDKNLSLLKQGGRLALIGSMGGADTTVNVRQIMRNRLTVGGSTIRAQSAAAKGTIATELLHICWPLFDTGELSVVLDSRRFLLEEAAEAHRLMEAGGHLGKIGLRIGE
jgi:NADPH:quinone reductase-like Zn-dependent oxidoreductase